MTNQKGFVMLMLLIVLSIVTVTIAAELEINDMQLRVAENARRSLASFQFAQRGWRAVYQKLLTHEANCFIKQESVFDMANHSNTWWKSRMTCAAENSQSVIEKLGQDSCAQYDRITTRASFRASIIILQVVVGVPKNNGKCKKEKNNLIRDWREL